MDKKSSKKSFRKKNHPPDNPIHDPLRQELAYKLNERASSCLLLAIPLGLLVAVGIAFLLYWINMR